MGKGLIIFFIIFIMVLLVGAILLYKYADRIIPQRKPEGSQLNTTLLIKLVDKDTGNQIDGEYILENDNYEIYNSKLESNKLEEKIVPSWRNYTIIAWNEDHYKKIQDIKLRSESQLEVTIPLESYSKVITLTHTPENFSTGENIMTITVKPDNYLKKLFICTKWSYNFIYVNLDNPSDICESRWNQTGPDNYICNLNNVTRNCEKLYHCDQSSFSEFKLYESCLDVSENKTCWYTNTEIPIRQKYYYDKCWNIYKDLNTNESYSFNLKYKLQNIGDYEYIGVLIVDQELIKDNQWNYVVQDKSNSDVGNEDFEYSIEMFKDG